MSPTPVAFAALLVAANGSCPKLGPRDCAVTATTGCLNGVSYEYSKSFACGPQQAHSNPKFHGGQAIYDWAETSCCASGNPYDMSTGFCCNNGVHSYSAGECKAWDSSFPEWCGCEGADTSSADVVLEVEAEPVIDAFDTLKVEANCPCGGPSMTMGCVNGHYYNYTTQYPCGTHIANWAQTGCCHTTEGLEPYNLRTQSCCREGDSNVLHSDGHACECSKYGCSRSSVAV